MSLLYARRRWALLTVLVLALALAPFSPLAARPAYAATAVPGDPLTGSGAVNRSVLTAADLTGGAAAYTVTDDAFALPAAAAAPTHTFEGTLTLNGVATAGRFRAIKDTYRYAATAALKHLPPVSIDLVQNGSHVIPAVRGLQITGSAYWNLIVGVAAPGTRRATAAALASRCPSRWSSATPTACTTVC